MAIENIITWIAEKLMQSGKDRETKKREQWNRVSDYFDDIAETLEKMIGSFRNKTIPRIEGNKLKGLIRSLPKSSIPFTHPTKTKTERRHMNYYPSYIKQQKVQRTKICSML